MSSKSFNIIRSTASKLSFIYLNEFINSYFVPIDYTRTKEIPALLDISGILERREDQIRILDIGSPQLLSLSLSLCSDMWDITYVNSFEMELDYMRRKSTALGLKRMRIVHADISQLDSLSELGSFDFIFSCSVFEHIHPEHGGDAIAATNITQLLQPNGKFIFSVPYYIERFNEYIDGPVYAIEGNPTGQTFFQRFYDEESLYNQLVIPTGLRVAGKSYIGEKFYAESNIRKRMALLIGHGKFAKIFGRFFNKISDVFMEESNDYKRLRKPYLAIFSLVKD